MNARETRLWLANDLEIKHLKKIEMNVANAHQKGGSSAGRFDRIFENKRDRNNTYQVETILKECYDFNIHRPKVAGFIIGGAAETRVRVFSDSALSVLKDYIVTNIPYLGSDPYKLYQETEQARQDYERNNIKKKISEIEELIEKSPDLLSFGIKETNNILQKVNNRKQIILQKVNNRKQIILHKCYVASSKLDEVKSMLSLSTSGSLVDVIEITDDSLEKWGNCVGILNRNINSYDDDDDDVDRDLNKDQDQDQDRDLDKDLDKDLDIDLDKDLDKDEDKQELF